MNLSIRIVGSWTTPFSLVIAVSHCEDKVFFVTMRYYIS